MFRILSDRSKFKILSCSLVRSVWAWLSSSISWCQSCPQASCSILLLLTQLSHLSGPFFISQIFLTSQLEPRWADKALEDGSPDVRSQAREVVARLKKEGDRCKLQFSMWHLCSLSEYSLSIKYKYSLSINFFKLPSRFTKCWKDVTGKENYKGAITINTWHLCNEKVAK